jgi:hypothetical protein
MEMFDLRGDCRPGDSGESAIDESGSGDERPNGEEVNKGMGRVCFGKGGNLEIFQM